MTASSPRPAGARGFTLLELIVVSGLVAMLLGLGFGYLRRGNSGRTAALSALAGALRTAAASAQVRGLPTEVRLEAPLEEGLAWRLRSRELLPVATFHLEKTDTTLAPVLRPVVTGEDVAGGRFGHCRRNKEGERAALARLPLLPADFDLQEGFAFRLDLLLERREACAVLRLGRQLELGIDAEGRPKARMVQTDAMGQTGATATLQAETAVAVGRWFTLEVAHDGNELWIALDGEVIVRTDAKKPLLQQPGDALEISPGDAAVPGLVDEVQWFQYTWSSPQPLPNDVVPEKPWRASFGSNGSFFAPELVLKLEKEDRQLKLQLRRGGILE